MVLLCLGLLICISSDSCFAGSLLAYRSSTRSNQATCFPSHLPHHCYSDGFRPNADDVAACRSLFVQRKQVFASGIKVLPPSHSAHHLNPNTPAAASLTLASSLLVTNLWPFLSRRELRCALAAAPCCAVTHSHSSLPMQLLKKGSTGLVVGNARASICAISGAARLTHETAAVIGVLAVYGPPIVGAQSHLAVEKVLTTMPAMRALPLPAPPPAHLTWCRCASFSTT